MSNSCWSRSFLITGGTGLIGRALLDEITQAGGRALVLTRDVKKHQHLASHQVHLIDSLRSVDNNETFDVVLNFAGAPIAAARWSDRRKATLLNSRLATTRALVALMRRLDSKPELFLSASAIGIYGDGGSVELNESSVRGEGFSSVLCDKWEREAKEAETLGVRTCITRLGVVLTEKGGSWMEFKKPLLFRSSPVFGEGAQWFSWISLDDLIAVMTFLISEGKQGVYNAVSPNPVRNRELADELYAQYGCVLKPKIPRSILRLLLGPLADELLLVSQKVEPQRLMNEAFRFEHETLHQCITAIRQRE